MYELIEFLYKIDLCFTLEKKLIKLIISLSADNRVVFGLCCAVMLHWNY